MSLSPQLLRAIAFLVLPTAVMVGGLQVLRWHAMGEPQRAALALIEAQPTGGDGSNAYPWLAAIDHEVPPDEIEDAMAAEVLRFEAWSEKRYLQATSGAELPTDRYTPFQDSGYAPRERLLGSRDICTGFLNQPCLANARARLDEHKALVVSESARLAVLDHVLAASHVSSPYAPIFWAPRLRFEVLHIEMTAAAVDAAEERPAAAFARACRLLDWSRQAAGSSDDWLIRSELRSHWESASGFLLELRREFPSHDLPPPCERALAPLQVEEFVNCAPEGKLLVSRTRGFAPARTTPFEAWNPLARVTRHLLDHPRLGAAWQAQELAQGCGESARDALATGAPLPPFEPAVAELGLSCFAAMQTCRTQRRWPREATPLSYRTWPQTAHHWARLQVLAAGHALADVTHDDAPPIPLPEIPGFPIEHDAPGQVLVIRLRVDRKVTEFLVDIAGLTPPLPASVD